MLPKKRKRTAEEEAKAWGIDITLIEASLERTPSQRILIHQSVLETALLLQEAVKRAQSSQNPPKNPLESN